MRSLSTLALLGPLVVAAVACTAQATSSEEDEPVSTVSAALGTAGCPGCTFTLPTPGSTGNAIPALEKAAIIAEWTQLAKDYYPVGGTTAPTGYAGYKKADGTIVMGPPPLGQGTNGAPAYAEIQQCEGNCPAYYSDLVCHFYSHMPSYNQVIPNVRGCFSNLARGGIPGSPSRLYPDIWDYCMYQDYDAVKNVTQPQWSATEIGLKVEKGVLHHLAPSLRPVFQYIMYTSYEPATYAQGDQKEIIDKVYSNLGQQPPQPLGGRATSPNAATIIPAMKAYFSAPGHSLQLAGAAKATPAPAPTAPPSAAANPGPDAVCKTVTAVSAAPATATTPAVAATTANASCKTCCQIVHAADGASAPTNTATCAAACPP